MILRLGRPAAAFVVLAATASGAQAPARRPLRLDDLDRVRQVADPQVSPDGQWGAYTLTRGDAVGLGGTRPRPQGPAGGGADGGEQPQAPRHRIRPLPLKAGGGRLPRAPPLPPLPVRPRGPEDRGPDPGAVRRVPSRLVAGR